MTITGAHFVSPDVSQFDQKVNISIHGLPSNQQVTVYAVARINATSHFESYAYYQTSETGSVEFDSDPSLGGSFTGVEPMGLFWSMQPFTTGKYLPRFAPKDALRPRQYDFYVADDVINDVSELRACVKEGGFAACTSMQRSFASEGVRRVEVKCDGLVGVLFLPKGEGPFPGILNLFGGFPGVLEFKSALHASQGFASLTLAYFGVPGLPKTFTKNLDLEYFEKGVKYLKNHPLVRGDRGIGLVGVCKGAQVALAMASCLDDISCLVWLNSSINAACGDITYKDQKWRQMGVDETVKIPPGAVELRRLYALPPPGQAEAKLEGLFPFYKKHSTSYLFIAGSDDRCSPAEYCAKEAEILLKNSGHPDFEIAHYPGAGHMLEPPFSPHCSVLFQPGKGFDFELSCGGSTLEHCRAQEDCWRLQMDFLRKRLMT